MPENRQDSTEPKADQPPQRRSLMVPSAVLGVTIGLFAGMSTTPVVGVLISGVLGLISGTLVVWLRPPEKLQQESDAAQKPAIEWTLVSAAVIPLCLGSILGGFIGIELRAGVVQNMISAERLVNLDPETLQKQSKVISNDKRVKLLLLQQSLAKVGVPVRDNNGVVSGFVADLSTDEERKALETTDEQLLPVRRYMQFSGEVLEVLRNSLDTLGDAANEIDSVIEKHEISDQHRVTKLRNVRRLLEELPPRGEIDRLAIEGKDIDRMLYRLEQPELDVALKHVRAFASASPPVEGNDSAIRYESRFRFLE